MSSSASLYIHIPFCRSKCGYCDFASFASLEHLYEEYVAALINEIEKSPQFSPPTIYFGGGTPSLLPIEMTTDIMAALKKRFRVPSGVEITLEVNPATISANGLVKLRDIGINRLSIGVQSFDAKSLKLLERDCIPQDAIDTIKAARKAGFSNISLDIMTALPEQTEASMIADLKKALEFDPEHLSVYQLTLHEERAMYKSHKMPDDEMQATLYETAVEFLTDNGYTHYEVSNFAKPGMECRHNLAAWLGEEYLGLGSGAHSFWNNRRFANHEKPESYIHSISKRGSISERQANQPKGELIDYLLMRLRLVDREINFSELNEKFDIDFSRKYGNILEKHAINNLLKVNENGFMLTRRGLLFLNNILLEFI